MWAVPCQDTTQQHTDGIEDSAEQDTYLQEWVQLHVVQCDELLDAFTDPLRQQLLAAVL